MADNEIARLDADTLVIGAGVAGLSCALELAGLGLRSIVLEAAPYPGGHAAGFSCKATDRCQRCAACMMEDMLRRARSSDYIRIIVRSAITAVEETPAGFGISVLQRPARVIPELCDGCLACVEACPMPGVLERPENSGTVSLSEARCGFFQDASCRACEEVCPKQAIDLHGTALPLQLEAPAVVIAAGFKPYDVSEKPRFGYGRVPGVVTAAELDSLLRAGSWDPAGGDSPVRSVAFVQCVGSRDARIGRNFCSRVCCGYALRAARLMKAKYPFIEPAFFYMDVQSYERDFEQRLSKISNEIRLVRSIPGEIRAGRDGRPEAVYQDAQGALVTEPFDLVVLSVGISPSDSQSQLAEMFGLDLNPDGFLGPDGEEVQTNRDGVFVAGTAQGPRSIPESIAHATKAAAAVAKFL